MSSPVSPSAAPAARPAARPAELRATIFRHLDGLVTAPVAYTLHERGVLARLLALPDGGPPLPLADLTREFAANEGYLNVALRVLAAQGWLTQHLDNAADTVAYAPTALGRAALPLAGLFADVAGLLALPPVHPRVAAPESARKWAAVAARLRARYDLPETAETLEQGAATAQVLGLIEGSLVGPLIARLGMSGMFHKYFMESSFRADEFHEAPESFRPVLDFFAHLGWFRQRGDTFEFTDTGLFFARRGAAYGVTVSYMPTFARLPDLIFGDPTVLWNVPDGAPERHVDREMNVWGSGGAHAGYFEVIDEIVIELFNRPIEEQPRGILDMGCGNGAFLEHLFTVIERQTQRGKMLDEHPLFLVGADFNQAALKVTRANLIKADIWAKVIWGDIGQPDRLAQDLQDNYGIALADLLNVRTFLDHNRPWNAPAAPTPGLASTSTGAFAHRGRRLPNHAVEDSLREHLTRWEPYVQRFGLLLIELHTIAPALTAAHLGRTPATAYDATHGFSDQYIVEADVFRRVATEAGLAPDARFFRRFPDSELATVSIQLLRGA